MTQQFEIRGGKPLRGEIEVRGAKNVAFPVMAASLLTNQPCFIDNLPLIEDVFRMIELLKSLGSQVDWISPRRVRIINLHISLSKIKIDIVSAFRGSILLYGSLLARIGKISLPQPGGCLLGARPIDTHLDAFSQLGAKVVKEGKTLKIEKGREKVQAGREILLNEFSVTATCNTLLFASKINGDVVIKIADEDYQTQELLRVLEMMGVRVKNIGHHSITISGRTKLRGFRYKIVPDPIEAGTFIILAAATKSRVLVKNVSLGFLELFIKKMQSAGVPLKISKAKNTVEVLPWKKLNLGKIQAMPYPGIHSDLLSAFAVLATQAGDSTLIQDPLYEGRFKYLEEINQMGAKIFFADPHRVIVQGPTPLYGKKLGSIDIRGGAALIIAALVAEGRSLIDNIYQIDRGYERIEERLQKLGADIKRINTD